MLRGKCYIEQRGYYNDKRRSDIGFRAPGVSVGIGVVVPPDGEKTKVSNRQLETDNFVSVARRVGAGESKELFEAKLKKVASAKSAKPQASK